MNRFYASLAAPSGWVGGVVVRAADADSAMQIAQKLSPDADDVLVFAIPDDRPIDDCWFGRLLTKEECERYVFGNKGEQITTLDGHKVADGWV